MNAKTFFQTFAHALKTNLPSYADEAMMHTLKNLGIEPGNDFDLHAFLLKNKHALKRLRVGTKRNRNNFKKSWKDKKRVAIAV